MSFKNALTKMGLVEEDVKVAPKKPVQQPAPQQSTQASYSAPSSYDRSVSVDPAIQEMLQQSLQSSKLDGFDYLKFMAAVEEMKSTGVQEDARFKMASYTAKQMGVDKDKLLRSGNHYLDVLKEDEGEFNSSCDDYEKNNITARDNKISQLEATMTKLAKQLSDAQADHDQLQKELAEQKAILETRKSSFSATLQNFRATIESNIQKINQYLQ